jgi:hypothetical protein
LTSREIGKRLNDSWPFYRNAQLITMKQPDFIICAPFAMANKSHGVRTLVELARAIERSGRRAFLCTYAIVSGHEAIFRIDFNSITPGNEYDKQFVDSILSVQRDYNVRFLSDFSPEYLAECYVIYPEAMAAPNALDAKHIIRYFLNKDGALTGRKVRPGPDDFILAFSQSMHPNPHHVCLYAGHDYETFCADNTIPTGERRFDVTYIGKGVLSGLTGIMPGTIEITRTWPKTKEQLAILLRNCRFFYTGDACSKINTEALSCGAVPVYLDNGSWTDEEIDSSEFGAVPRLRPNTTIGPDFFAEFEVRRTEFMKRVEARIDDWERSVQQMIDKCDRHFAQRP